MIKYEHNTLVLDASHSKEDQKAINDFIDYISKQERQKVLDELDKLESHSRQTRTPLYQDTIFSHLRFVLGEAHPPKKFRDRSNGE